MGIPGATILFVMISGISGLVIGGIFGYLLGAGQNTKVLKKEEMKKKKLCEIAVLWRNRENGRLIIEAGNKFMPELDGFNPEKVIEIQQAIGELSLNLPESASRKTGSEAVKPVISEKSGAQGSLGSAPTVAWKDSSISKELNQIATGAFEEKPDTTASIVMQIDKVLQKLLADPKMKNRIIRLTEDPKTGVVVWVGFERFNGIDAVTDPEVKDLIQKAVNEWENSVRMKK
jgi:hypothetical protein